MKKYAILVLFVLAAMIAAPAQATDTITVRGDLNVTGSINGTGVVPVGGIIDWWRPSGSSLTIPANFKICDGSAVSDAASPFNGKNVPDLRQKFVRGGGAYSDIGQTGGSATATASGTTASGGRDHTHTLASTTGLVSDDDNSAGSGNCYYTKDDNKGWGSNCGSGTKVHIRVDAGDNNEGQHRHVLGGSTGSASTGHTHTFSAQVDTVPPYFTLLKIIRIK
ncbi:hypothetical protein AAU61_19160 [Desulfocarbo indianensis]|nr:hypothetical protein AAU61_19160 [Desulfocarbo indianensis]